MTPVGAALLLRTLVAKLKAQTSDLSPVMGRVPQDIGKPAGAFSALLGLLFKDVPAAANEAPTIPGHGAHGQAPASPSVPKKITLHDTNVAAAMPSPSAPLSVKKPRLPDTSFASVAGDVGVTQLPSDLSGLAAEAPPANAAAHPGAAADKAMLFKPEPATPSQQGSTELAAQLPPTAGQPKPASSGVAVAQVPDAGLGSKTSLSGSAAATVSFCEGGKPSKERVLADDGGVSALVTLDVAGHHSVAFETEVPKPALPLVQQFGNQVGARLDQLRQMGRVEVQFDLHPAELGRMRLHLAIEDGRVNVRMVVQDDAIKRLIDVQLAPLRVRLAEMGVSVGQFDVRRDGGSPNPNRQPPPEPSLQPIQAARNGRAPPRKVYGSLGNAAVSVDVIV